MLLRKSENNRRSGLPRNLGNLSVVTFVVDRGVTFKESARYASSRTLITMPAQTQLSCCSDAEDGKESK